MTDSSVIRVESQAEACNKIHEFLEKGDTAAAVGVAQVLWAVCDTTEDFLRCLDDAVSRIRSCARLQSAKSASELELRLVDLSERGRLLAAVA